MWDLTFDAWHFYFYRFKLDLEIILKSVRDRKRGPRGRSKREGRIAEWTSNPEDV